MLQTFSKTAQSNQTNQMNVFEASTKPYRITFLFFHENEAPEVILSNQTSKTISLQSHQVSWKFFSTKQIEEVLS
jgi:hypothetical protein